MGIRRDKMIPAYWNRESFSDYVRRMQGISKKTK
nr:MAG TPA: hypothetical protein [Caudoviricetes sp.]